MDQKNFYNKMFKEGEGFRWEMSPGKDVFINAFKGFIKEGLIPTTGKVVDVGCGTGFLLNRIKKECSKTFELYGIDISKEAVEIGSSCYPDINLSCLDATKTDYPDELFDIILLYGSLEHFLDPLKAMEEMFRILKTGGLIFCMVPTLGIDRTDRNDEGWYEERSLGDDHKLQMQWNYKRGTWESLFTKSGFTLFEEALAYRFGAIKSGVFYFCRKEQR